MFLPQAASQRWLDELGVELKEAHAFLQLAVAPLDGADDSPPASPALTPAGAWRADGYPTSPLPPRSSPGRGGGGEADAGEKSSVDVLLGGGSVDQVLAAAARDGVSEPAVRALGVLGASASGGACALGGGGGGGGAGGVAAEDAEDPASEADEDESLKAAEARANAATRAELRLARDKRNKWVGQLSACGARMCVCVWRSQRCVAVARDFSESTMPRPSCHGAFTFPAPNSQGPEFSGNRDRSENRPRARRAAAPPASHNRPLSPDPIAL